MAGEKGEERRDRCGPWNDEVGCMRTTMQEHFFFFLQGGGSSQKGGIYLYLHNCKETLPGSEHGGLGRILSALYSVVGVDWYRCAEQKANLLTSNIRVSC